MGLSAVTAILISKGICYYATGRLRSTDTFPVCFTPSCLHVMIQTQNYYPMAFFEQQLQAKIRVSVKDLLT